MKYLCPKCGTESEISLAQCASSMGKEGIKIILQTPEQIKKDWHSKGGFSRSAKYSKEQLSEWAKRGGRPRKVKKDSLKDIATNLNLWLHYVDPLICGTTERFKELTIEQKIETLKSMGMENK